MFFFVVSELRNAQINTSEYTYYRRLSEKLGDVLTNSFCKCF